MDQKIFADNLNCILNVLTIFVSVGTPARAPKKLQSIQTLLFSDSSFSFSLVNSAGEPSDAGTGLLIVTRPDNVSILNHFIIRTVVCCSFGNFYLNIGE